MVFRARRRVSAFAAAAAALVTCAYAQAPQSSASADAAFQRDVVSVLQNTCSGCHNSEVSSGGLNVANFEKRSSLAQNREGWEIIVRKIRNGEMPPPGIPRPAKVKVAALLKAMEAEFAAADRNIKPDPGRVTARRLNRTEYWNTIRDLLGVEFRADATSPPTIPETASTTSRTCSTISPVLMEKYL